MDTACQGAELSSLPRGRHYFFSQDARKAGACGGGLVPLHDRNNLIVWQEDNTPNSATENFAQGSDEQP